MSCRITSEGVFAENGQPSKLYNDLLSIAGNEESAKSLYAISELDDFKTTISKPLKNTFPGVFDSNGEIAAKYIVRYATNLNKDTSKMSVEEITQTLDMLSNSLGVSDSNELHLRMTEAFYDDMGLFNPSLESMLSSGLYNQYEAKMILTDIGMQQSIKEALDRLGNSESIDVSFSDAPLEYADKTEEMNVFGKSVTKNPYEEKQKVIQQYGGTENLNMTVDEIENIALQKSIEDEYNRQALIQELESYRRFPHLIDQNGTLVPYVEKNIKPNAIKLQDNRQLISDLQLLKEINPSLLQSEEALSYVQKLEKDLANIGLDLTGWSITPNYTRLIEPLQNFLFNPNSENTEALETAYNEVFEITPTEEEVVVVDDSDMVLEYIETTKTEEEMFDAGYLKTTVPNMYHKIEKVSYEELIDILSEDRPMKEVVDTINKEAIKLKDVRNNDKAKEIVAYKMYFGHPTSIEYSYRYATDIAMKAEAFTGNTEYLSEDFVADFNATMINEKQKESVKYKEFYSKFGINEKGIYLKSQDPLTLAKLNEWLKSDEIANAEDIINYSAMSKNMPLLGEAVEPTTPTKNTMRVLYANSPTSLPLTERSYSNMNDMFLTMENATEEFIRTPKGVYEMIETKGNTSIYSIIPSNQDANYFRLEPIQSISSEDLEWTKVFREGGVVETPFVEEKSLATKEEKDRIQQENFDCI